MGDHILDEAVKARSFAKLIFDGLAGSDAPHSPYTKEVARSCMVLSDTIINLRAEQIKIEEYMKKLLKEEKTEERDFAKEIDELKRRVDLLVKLEKARRKKE